MIIRTQEVRQPVDGDEPVRFVKEIVRVPGPEPLCMVRKRLPPEDLPPGGLRAPVVLTHGFGQNRYAWHLSGRSFANHLAREGHDVYNLDLRGHGRSRALGSRACAALDGYIHEDLPRALDVALTLSRHPRGFLVGHSLGGLVAYAAAPALRERLAGLVAIGSPYVYGRGNRLLLEATRALSFAATRLRGTGAFPMKLVRALFRAHPALWNTALLPLPIRAWHPGSIERHLLEEYIRLSFDSATIGEFLHVVASGIRGRFASQDGALDYAAAWEALDVPLLVVAGSRDLLAPVASVRPAYDRSASRDKTLHVLPFGHGDLILGRDAPRTTWRLVTTWLREHLPDEAACAPYAARERHPG